jgi:hypothetical protein
MSALLQHIDQLTHLSSNLSSTSTSITAASGPFTHAVIHAPLQHLIRDADHSELALFTLAPTSNTTTAPGTTQTRDRDRDLALERVPFAGATPLKRRPLRHKPDSTATQPKQEEIDPQIYARAALKYLDRL